MAPMDFGPACSVKEALVITTVIFGIVMVLILALSMFVFPATGSASDYSACGIKPPPPMSCVHCQATCMCDEKGNCGWVWVSGVRR